MAWSQLIMSPDSSRLLFIFAFKRPIDKVAAKRYTKRKGEFLSREIAADILFLFPR